MARPDPPASPPAPGGTTAYVALGGNLGDRLANLRAAAAALAGSAGVTLEGRSAVYETEAVAESPQPAYLNAVVRVATQVGPEELLELCLAIERRLGRVRPAGKSKAPRTIDLDLLLHGQHVRDQPGLHLPHPGLLARAFVRVPLADVAEPGLSHPVTREALDHAEPDPRVRRLLARWG